jgi:signal transduction histidine kinase
MVITVEDHGSGIPESFRDRLFDRFSQAPGQKGGTGLGLAIVRELVGAFGGEIGFQSTENVGTTFIVKLPEIVGPSPE